MDERESVALILLTVEIKGENFANLKPKTQSESFIF